MNWDTLIVGGGSAGCVLAGRLSEDPTHRVLLLEAGPAHDPEALPKQVEHLGRGHAWPIEWGEQVQSSDGRALPYLRGRGIGGSSSINGGVAMRAEPADLAHWPKAWRWNSMLPWLCRIENDLDFGSEAYHGSDGAIPITRFGREDWDPTYQAFHSACLRTGIPDCEDHNAPDTTGVGAIPMNRDGSRRLFAGVTHLFPALGRRRSFGRSAGHKPRKSRRFLLALPERAPQHRAPPLRLPHGGEHFGNSGHLHIPRRAPHSGCSRRSRNRPLDLRKSRRFLSRSRQLPNGRGRRGSPRHIPSST